MSMLLAILLVASFPPVTRWASPDNSRPLTYLEWLQDHPAGPTWQAASVRTIHAGDSRVTVIVEDRLVEPLAEQLDSMLVGLARDGWTAALVAARGTAPESLRAFLQAERDSGLVSAVLIGNLPVAWFQMLNDFNNRGVNDGYEEFPCDLYFMDLDGTWLDTLERHGSLDSLVPGEDGKFDTHTGDVGPEIGVSRMYVHRLSNGEARLRAHLERSHAWRSGTLPSSGRALTYIDDDWSLWAPGWDQSHGLVYFDRTAVWDPETTKAVDYRDRIRTMPLESVLLCAHSWPGGHQMAYAQRDSHDYYYASWLPVDNPEGRFWNLFACSNARYVEWNNAGGLYVFGNEHGLNAVGSTKTGSMLEFQDWYLPLALGASFNEAFRDWFAARAAGGFHPGEQSWFYGMTLIGDGTLRPRGAAGLTADPASLVPAGTPPRTIYTAGELRNIVAGEIYDALGRKADPTRLVPGVYYLRAAAGHAPRRVVVAR